MGSAGGGVTALGPQWSLAVYHVNFSDAFDKKLYVKGSSDDPGYAATAPSPTAWDVFQEGPAWGESPRLRPAPSPGPVPLGGTGPFLAFGRKGPGLSLPEFSSQGRLRV